MNARRTHALSFLLNSDLQLMSSGRQTGSRLGGWDARPEEALLPSWLPQWLPIPSKASGPNPSLRFLQERIARGPWEQESRGAGEQGSREGCRFGEGFGYKILE